MNAIGLALTGWIAADEIMTAHAAPAPVATLGRPPAEEQPHGPCAPAAADATAAPSDTRPARGPHGQACRRGTRSSATA
ncbi:hypothetical protein PUR49_10880 [Streptomyces sp. BE147]|uniref:hypothetical protein n=1 Tax=Streptomyces sp. BE147 TaxID=3002524 RepID=UPI002E77C640|nr:hypothetical protein [Streptomyces sp. BE147]MEE1737002.1 hypothetical protein [Streptomyces sp. BE147]